ncbi:hypothetical protein NQ315_016303 [Exocentrus adspersus]|uniref:Pseudouridine-5'-phosphate glycosidase n=1 Tax=Exocentrus adspersus TaxID=1586481 RepID=A0AAV8VPQ4_9CUCU|nr:hypothetical protein NQ315_016303 [Exocentrus adspersus]
MYRQVQKLVSVSTRVRFSALNRYFSNSYIDVKEEVRSALETGKPVVALESTIITHGMPFPENIKCAFEVENTVRNQGAVPATVAIVNGRVKVGLSSEELSLLGDTKASSPIKTSRRDMPYIISNKLNGGTTVCGTLVVASKVDIPVFATGGIGGVHRNAHETFDISADLVELGRCGIAVVSSGVKSILDISKTLEYLETQGVFVATFGGSKEFPAFYSRISGCEAPYSLKTEEEAARVIKCSRELDMKSGLLIAVPVPESDALAPELINSVIQEALDGVIKHKVNVLGKDITPHLLEAVARITSGKSLKTNIALIKNNAKVAASISVALAALNGKTGIVEANAEGFKRQPVSINTYSL